MLIQHRRPYYLWHSTSGGIEIDCWRSTADETDDGPDSIDGADDGANEAIAGQSELFYLFFFSRCWCLTTSDLFYIFILGLLLLLNIFF